MAPARNIAATMGVALLHHGTTLMASPPLSLQAHVCQLNWDMLTVLRGSLALPGIMHVEKGYGLKTQPQVNIICRAVQAHVAVNREGHCFCACSLFLLAGSSYWWCHTNTNTCSAPAGHATAEWQHGAWHGSWHGSECRARHGNGCRTSHLGCSLATNACSQCLVFSKHVYSHPMAMAV